MFRIDQLNVVQVVRPPTASTCAIEKLLNDIKENSIEQKRIEIDHNV